MSSNVDTSKSSETDALLPKSQLSNNNNIPNYDVSQKDKSKLSNPIPSIPKIRSASNLKSKATNEEEDAKEEKGTTLLIAFLLMLFFQLGNRIFGRLQTFPMHNYPLFMNMLSTCIYVPICFVYILPVVWSKSSAISKEELSIPKYKFGVMGFYDSVAGIMQAFAVNYISNSSTIVLVQQSAIPISMVISKITLKAEYTLAQYWGAFIVLFGIFLVLLPTFFTTSTKSLPVADQNPYELWWIFLMMISCVPMCLSSVYKEQALGEAEINIVYLNGWVAVFQSLFAIPLCIPSATVIGLPLNKIMDNMYGGMLCVAGINSLESDVCGMAPIYVSIYLAFNVVFNFLIVVILKHGSANILWMASTIIVPLSNVAFSLKFMPGNKPLKMMDIVGLFVIMAGLIIYRFMTPLVEFVNSALGRKQDLEESEIEAMARKISRVITKKYSNYVGLNQIESLQTVIDSKINLEHKNKRMFRSSDQIRGNLLVRLGIPPSPAIAMQGVKNSPFATPVLTKRQSDVRDPDFKLLQKTNSLLPIKKHSMTGPNQV